MPGHQHKKNFLQLPDTWASKISRTLLSITFSFKRSDGSCVEGAWLSDTRLTTMGMWFPRCFERLGYGCDEEALRLVRILSFEKVKTGV